MTAQVAADLRAAADVLERDGWVQGIYHDVIDGSVCHCAEGAIALAIGQHVHSDDVPGDDYTFLDMGWWARTSKTLWARREAAEGALQVLTDGDVVHWNDAPGRTAAEVIAALRAAADRAEAEQ